MARVLLVCGSPSAVSRTAAALDAVGLALAAAGHETDSLSVRDLPPAAVLHAEFADPELLASAARVERADALVIGTPVYKAAYSGLLKSWLDLLPRYALAGKATLPLATGGTLAHALVLDYALRPVLSSMAAAHIAQGCFLLDRSIVTSPDGTPPRLTREAADRVGRTVAGLLTVLPAAGVQPQAA